MYYVIDLWIVNDMKWLVKVCFFVVSGSVLKIVYYWYYQDWLGVVWLMEIVIIDGLDFGWVMVMCYFDYVWCDILDVWL